MGSGGRAPPMGERLARKKRLRRRPGSSRESRAMAPPAKLPKTAERGRGRDHGSRHRRLRKAVGFGGRAGETGNREPLGRAVEEHNPGLEGHAEVGPISALEGAAMAGRAMGRAGMRPGSWQQPSTFPQRGHNLVSQNFHHTASHTLPRI